MHSGLREALLCVYKRFETLLEDVRRNVTDRRGYSIDDDIRELLIERYIGAVAKVLEHFHPEDFEPLSQERTKEIGLLLERLDSSVSLNSSNKNAVVQTVRR